MSAPRIDLIAGGQLRALERDALDLLTHNLQEVSFKQGQRVFTHGEPARDFVLVTEGELKVYTTTSSGRDIVLYKVGPGETCILTTVGLIGGGDYEAEAIAEQPTRALVFPKHVFDELLAQSARFRTFVFSAYAGRLQSMIALVQDFSARHLDRKLARLLVDAGDQDGLQMTHQQVANELNSSREVITRLLHDFSGRGWVTLKRGKIVISNRRALDLLAQEL